MREGLFYYTGVYVQKVLGFTPNHCVYRGDCGNGFCRCWRILPDCLSSINGAGKRQENTIVCQATPICTTSGHKNSGRAVADLDPGLNIACGATLVTIIFADLFP